MLHLGIVSCLDEFGERQKVCYTLDARVEGEVVVTGPVAKE
jgi:hypothetical protein